MHFAQHVHPVITTNACNARARSCSTRHVLDPIAVEEEACDLLTTCTVGPDGVLAAFCQAPRQGATLGDLKGALHVAQTADCVHERMAQFSAIRAAPTCVGMLDLEACRGDALAAAPGPANAQLQDVLAPHAGGLEHATEQVSSALPGSFAYNFASRA